MAPSSAASGGPSRRLAGRIPIGRGIRSERGTALVEFALIAPLLFLLVGGIIDFARALNYYNDLTQLAGQGVRAAIVASNPDGTAPSDATAELKGSTSSNGIQVQVLDPNNAGAATVNPIAGQPLTVKTSFDFNFIVPLVKIAIPGPFLHLSTSSTMRVEQRTGTPFSTTPQNVSTCP
jgi:Flp pilus assembly protein TadG